MNLKTYVQTRIEGLWLVFIGLFFYASTSLAATVVHVNETLQVNGIQTNFRITSTDSLTNYSLRFECTQFGGGSWYPCVYTIDGVRREVRASTAGGLFSYEEVPYSQNSSLTTRVLKVKYPSAGAKSVKVQLCTDPNLQYCVTNSAGGNFGFTLYAPTAGTFDVGVIPNVRYACPEGSDIVEMYMDDEDYLNGNSRSGWIGGTVSTANTQFTFCRVNGLSFFPTTRAAGLSGSYAVVKLGTSCPPYSRDYSRAFDNEDDNNKNSSTLDAAPNISDRNTRIRLCIFGSDTAYSSSTPIMSAFPNLGMEYGVFYGSSTFVVKPISTGWFVSDDEDSGNANGMDGFTTYGQYMMGSGRTGSTSQMNVMRVK